jgi:hypothetical protein
VRVEALNPSIVGLLWAGLSAIAAGLVLAWSLRWQRTRSKILIQIGAIAVVQTASIVGVAVLRDDVFAMNEADAELLETFYAIGLAVLVIPMVIVYLRLQSAR